MLAVSQEPDNTSLESLMTLKSLKTERVKLFGAKTADFAICSSFSNRGSNLTIIHIVENLACMLVFSKEPDNSSLKSLMTLKSLNFAICLSFYEQKK